MEKIVEKGKFVTLTNKHMPLTFLVWYMYSHKNDGDKLVL